MSWSREFDEPILLPGGLRVFALRVCTPTTTNPFDPYPFLWVKPGLPPWEPHVRFRECRHWSGRAVRCSSCAILLRPVVPTLGEQPDPVAVPNNHHPVAVVLDLVEPVQPGRNLLAGRANGKIECLGHGGQILAETNFEGDRREGDWVVRDSACVDG